MSRKCPTCEKTVYMGKRWIFSNNFQTLTGFILTLTHNCRIIFFISCSVAFKKCQRINFQQKRFWFSSSIQSLQQKFLCHSVEHSVLFCQKSKMLSFFDLMFFVHPRALTGEKKESLGNWYHPLCLKCKKCGRQLATGNHAEVN